MPAPSATEPARPRVRDVVRAEWRRLGEPPEAVSAATDALRERPVVRALVCAAVLVGVAAAWWWAPREVATVVTAVGVTVVGAVTGWPMRRRTRDEFEVDQRERVERIQERDRVRGGSGPPRRPA